VLPEARKKTGPPGPVRLTLIPADKTGEVAGVIMEAAILTAQQVEEVRTILDTAAFRAGSHTAGRDASLVKHNEQANPADPAVGALAARVRLALEAHPLVGAWARPCRWSPLLFARYRAGDHYGRHTDNAIMFDTDGWPLRTDISFTLMLSDPDSYEGGALRIEGADGVRSRRPPAGTALFYPTGAIHAVEPVAHGIRTVCVGWLQSRIRRADQRDLLHDLERLREGVSGGDQAILLDRTLGNLLRMWAED
jgi:PKHD-type hydroxylase